MPPPATDRADDGVFILSLTDPIVGQRHANVASYCQRYQTLAGLLVEAHA